MRTRYRNPWHRPGHDDSPEFFETDAKPIEHAGCQIFKIFPRAFDVVKDGTCIRQMAGFEGAKRAAEAYAVGGTYPEGHEFPCIASDAEVL